MEAIWTIFLPHFSALRSLIAQKTLTGKQLLVADFSFSAPYDLNNRVFDPALGGGALLDVGIYPVMLAIEVFGPPAKISAHSISTPDDVDATTSIVMTHLSGEISSLTCSIQQNGRRTAEILGENGRIEIGHQWWKPSSLNFITDKKHVDHTPQAQGLGYHYEISHVQDCIDQGELESDIWSHKKSIALMETLDQIRALIGLEYRL